MGQYVGVVEVYKQPAGPRGSDSTRHRTILSALYAETDPLLPATEPPFPVP